MGTLQGWELRLFYKKLKKPFTFVLVQVECPHEFNETIFENKHCKAKVKQASLIKSKELARRKASSSDGNVKRNCESKKNKKCAV